MEKQQYYKDDEPLMEISQGVFAPVKVKEVIDPSQKLSFGQYRYVVSPVGGRGAMVVTGAKLLKA